MSIGWALLVNTLIGIVLMVPLTKLMIWYVEKILGASIKDCVDANADSVEQIAQSTGKQPITIYYLNIVLACVIWEIEWPLKFYMVKRMLEK